MVSTYLDHQTYQKLMAGANYKDSTFRRIYKAKKVFYHPTSPDPAREYEIQFKDEQAVMFFKLKWL